METLVLSATWEPVRRVTWKRAMTLWVAGRVEVLEAYSERRIRTVSSVFELPSVVRFLRGKPRRRAIVKFSRDNVFLRDKGRCMYCGAELLRREATYDHVLPKSRGGQTSWENLVLACRSCNHGKANRTPLEAGMRLRSTPIRPKSLQGFLRNQLRFREDMPEAWRPYLGG